MEQTSHMASSNINMISSGLNNSTLAQRPEEEPQPEPDPQWEPTPEDEPDTEPDPNWEPIPEHEPDKEPGEQPIPEA